MSDMMFAVLICVKASAYCASRVLAACRFAHGIIDPDNLRSLTLILFLCLCQPMMTGLVEYGSSEEGDSAQDEIQSYHVQVLVVLDMALSVTTNNKGTRRPTILKTRVSLQIVQAQVGYRFYNIPLLNF